MESSPSSTPVEKDNQKILCQCGSEILLKNISVHNKTKKHIKKLNELGVGENKDVYVNGVKVEDKKVEDKKVDNNVICEEGNSDEEGVDGENNDEYGEDLIISEIDALHERFDVIEQMLEKIFKSVSKGKK